MKTLGFVTATLILCTGANAQTDTKIMQLWRVCQDNFIAAPKRSPADLQKKSDDSGTFKPGYDGCEEVRKAYGETPFARHERMLKEKEDTEKAEINGLVGKIKK